MRVAVLGATGRAGSQIARELAARGHFVKGIAGHPESIAAAGVEALIGDASDPQRLAGLVGGSDAVISALHFDVVSADSLLSALRQAAVSRLLVVGGAAGLEVAPGKRVIDAPNFPPSWKVKAQEGIDFLERLCAEEKIAWTFFSPAALLFEGPRLGVFRLGGDRLVVDEVGESRISFADYAIAMVDELERSEHIRQRFTAAY